MHRRFPNAFTIVDAENTEEYRNGAIFYLQFLSPRCFIIIKLYISSASIIVSFLSTLIYCKWDELTLLLGSFLYQIRSKNLSGAFFNLCFLILEDKISSKLLQICVFSHFKWRTNSGHTSLRRDSVTNWPHFLPRWCTGWCEQGGGVHSSTGRERERGRSTTPTIHHLLTCSLR